MRSTLRWLTIVVLLGVAGAAAGQGPRAGHRFGGPPAFLEQLFVPELIMRYQADIGLTDEQRAAITKAMTDAQAQLVELQWQFEKESKQLTDMLASAQIDESAALAQADRVMNLELQMKRTHLALLIRVKQVLTPDQQSKLRALRLKEPPRGGPPSPR
jgi:Spy/CpxP family protein refolding chaperone